MSPRDPKQQKDCRDADRKTQHRDGALVGEIALGLSG